VVSAEGFDNLLEDERSPAGREFPPDYQPYYVPDGPDRVRRVPRAQAAGRGVDGRFIMRVGVPEQPKTVKLTLIVANEDNVIVSKEVQVRIVPAE